MAYRWTCLLLVVVLACKGKQAPTAPPSEVAMPTPTAPPVARVEPGPTAEQQFTAWLDAFNAGDRDKLLAATKNMTPELAKEFGTIDNLLGFRDQVGGFEVKKVEEVKETRYVAIVKERSGDQFARAIVETEAAPPRMIRTFDIRIVPLPDEFHPPRMTEAAAIEAVRAELDKLVAADRFAGAVLIAKNGKPIFAQAYGLADRAKKIPNELKTRFRIGSMNKMFTAVATLQLVQAGKLALDATIDKYLPDYPNKNVSSKVTIHHLLTHSGGTGDIFGPDYEKNRLTLRTLEDYVKLYGARDLDQEPGTKMQYSNYGFLLLGVIVARVSKQSYYDRVATSIFKPTGMTSTESPIEDPTKPSPGRSIAYTKQSAGTPLPEWTAAWDTLPVRATSAGGGDSTVEDLLRFANALRANKLLNAKHTELLTTGKIDSANGDKYAYGFSDTVDDGVRCVGHGGGAPGMNGDLQICDSGYTIAILANLDPPAANRLTRFIKQRLPK